MITRVKLTSQAVKLLGRVQTKTRVLFSYTTNDRKLNSTFVKWVNQLQSKTTNIILSYLYISCNVNVASLTSYRNTLWKKQILSLLHTFVQMWRCSNIVSSMRCVLWSNVFTQELTANKRLVVKIKRICPERPAALECANAPASASRTTMWRQYYISTHQHGRRYNFFFQQKQ